MANIGVKAKVTGQVQGVGFRYHTAHEGLKRGLTGYAQNEADGSVTVMINGEEQEVMELVDWLHQGPPTAYVREMDYQRIDWQFFDGFSIR